MDPAESVDLSFERFCTPAAADRSQLFKITHDHRACDSRFSGYSGFVDRDTGVDHRLVG